MIQHQKFQMAQCQKIVDTTSMVPLEVDKEEFVDIQPMLLLEGHEEEVKEGKRSKILTPNRLLTRLPILSAQIKAGNNS